MKLISSFVLALLVLSPGPAMTAPQDLEDSFQKLKDAEQKNDAELVKTLAAEVHALTRKEMAEPAPSDPEEKESWNKRVGYLKEVAVYAEYSLFAVGSRSDPKVMIDLMGTLEAQNPKSKYLDMAYGPLLAALNQTGAAAKIPAVAEKGLQSFPENEDLLAYLADRAIAANQNERAASLATRLTNAVTKHPKPENMSAADWERRKSTLLGRGYWIAGVVHGADPRGYAAANRELRAALPLIQGNDAMTSAALFYLGVANFQLGVQTLNKAQVLEAEQFSLKASKFAGPYAEQAYRNALAARTKAASMR